MRVFGSLYRYVLLKKDVQRLDACTREELMMGYSTQSKGYIRCGMLMLACLFCHWMSPLTNRAIIKNINTADI